MGILRRTGLSAASLVAVVACNAINGVGDLSIDDADAMAPLPSRSSEDGSTVQSEASVAPDAGDASDEDAPPIATGTCTCAPKPPQGWEGPLALGESLQGAGPACEIGLVTAYRGGVPPEATPPCTPCTCGAPGAGARCDTTLTLWNSSNCAAGTQCASVALSGTSCSPVTYCNGGSLTSAMRTSLTPVGSCGAASGGAKTAPAFAREATACALANAPANACDAASACAPSPGAGTKTCIRQSGEVACPAGPYTAQNVFYASLVDGRTCSACSCSGTCSGGGTRIYSENACATSLDTTGPNACDSIPANSQSGSARVYTLPTFACRPSGGVVSGAVTGKDPTTFCCLP